MCSRAKSLNMISRRTTPMTHPVNEHDNLKGCFAFDFIRSSVSYAHRCAKSRFTRGQKSMKAVERWLGEGQRRSDRSKASFLTIVTLTLCDRCSTATHLPHACSLLSRSLYTCSGSATMYFAAGSAAVSQLVDAYRVQRAYERPAVFVIPTSTIR